MLVRVRGRNFSVVEAKWLHLEQWLMLRVFERLGVCTHVCGISMDVLSPEKLRTASNALYVQNG